MAWYNSWRDALGDLGQIATGHNPMNNPPPAPAPYPNNSVSFPTGTPQPKSTGATYLGYDPSGTDTGGDSTMATDDGSGSSSGFSLPAGLTWGDILKFGGNLAGGIGQYAMSESQLKQQADEFAKTLEEQKAIQAQQDAQFQKTYGLSANNQMMGAQSQLNRAPLADKGQALALNMAAPTPFQPRDYTQGGTNAIRGTPTGGAAAQVAANSAAAANYKAGDGGVDTSVLKMILQRLGAGPNGSATPPTATGPNGGELYGPGGAPNVPTAPPIAPAAPGGTTPWFPGMLLPGQKPPAGWTPPVARTA